MRAELIFLASLVLLILLIFLLSLMSFTIDHETHRARYEKATIIIFGLTGIFALIAAVAASISAVILNKQQGDFVDQEQRQLRAYVFPDAVAIYNADADISKQSAEAPRLEIYMKNTGVTPAYDVTTFVGATLTTFPDHFTMADVYSGPMIILANTSVNVLPHEARQQSITPVFNAEQPLTVEQKVSLNNGETAIYFYGETTYYDAFEIRRCTRFKYFVGGNMGFNGTNMAHAPEGQEADKDCHRPEEIANKRLPLQLPSIPHYQF